MWTDVSCAVPPALQRSTNPSGFKPQEYFPYVYSLQLRQDSADETNLTDPGLTHSVSLGGMSASGKSLWLVHPGRSTHLNIIIIIGKEQKGILL